MTGITKWIPRLILALAVIHLAYAFIEPYLRNPLVAMMSEGLVNTGGTDAARETSVWFVLTGLSWLCIGELARWIVRETGRIPVGLGIGLLGVAIPLIVVMPASGGWLVAAIGVLALVGARGGRIACVPGQAALRAATRL